MRRADRLFQIVQYLRGGRLVTAAKLSESLEVSERTIYRDIAHLQACGVPIEGEAGIGYVLRQGFEMPPLMFTRDELVALTAGARLLRAWGGAAMARAAEEALIKIDVVLPDELKGRSAKTPIHSIATHMDDESRKRLDEIEKAVDAKQKMHIDYADAGDQRTARVIRPLGLWFWGNRWTLVAWCELRADFRMFRIDRMSSLQVRDSERFVDESGKSLRDFLRQLEEEEGQSKTCS